ncbi:hypothetical protein TWF694_006395 [Orbilia ellipsospora]|uniref:Ankyrin repeat protein n=1 Tax=Orbilia ellipsospora TaxID=2528407 RepID=A0AAV9XLG6_9PEZI
MAAARAMLDISHGRLEEQDERDKNNYHLGSIGKHNVAIACLPAGVYGTTSAAIVAAQMLFTFPSIRFGLMVGIGGGIPREGHDIRLGDIVVSKPDGPFGGVVQYDFGKSTADGFVHTGSLNKPPVVLLNAIASLQAEHELEDSKVSEYVSSAKFKGDYSYQGAQNDTLFLPDYDHVGEGDSCQSCDSTKVVSRPNREDTDPMIHYGTITSGNQVIKNAKTRDLIGKEFNSVCFEMEAAGLMDNFPCLVVRGICDYSDSHKNKRWQRYAAAVAAGYAKELLGMIAPKQLGTAPMAVDAIKADKVLRNILEWLTPIDYGPRQSYIFSCRQEGTGIWLLESPQFQSWIDSRKSTSLLCPGIPGVGKTVMASIAVEYLIKKFPSNAFSSHNTGVGFVYCNYSMHETQQGIDLVSALLKQLLEQLPEVSEGFQSWYENHKRHNTRPPMDEATDMLLLLSKSYSRIFLVVDALDECKDEPRRTLISAIRMMQQQTHVNLMATSRPITHIMNEFDKDIILPIDASNDDIGRYLDGQVPRLPHSLSSDASLVHEVKSKIIECAAGMFLLAKLHFDSLTDRISRKEIRSALEKLPRGEIGLRQAYENAMQRIESQPPKLRALAERVLSWITHSKRVLTVRELLYAFAIEPNTDSYDEGNLPDLDMLVSVCAGLVTIDQERNMIRLVHYTTQEYFQGVGADWVAKGPRDMASTCLTCLCFKTFTSGCSPNDEKLKVRFAQNALYSYAAMYWGQHSHSIQNDIKKEIRPFLKSSALVSAAYQAIVRQPLRYHFNTEPFLFSISGLHLATHFNLLSIVVDVLREGELDINAKDDKGQTALMWAARLKNRDIVKVLLEYGAEPNIQDNDGSSALHYGATDGEITRLLVSSKADVKVVTKGGRTALHCAAESGCEEAAKYLIVNGANVDIYVAGGWTPIQIAARRGNREVVEVLIENGAALNQVTGLPWGYHDYSPYDTDDANAEGKLAIHLAAEYGYEDIVRALIIGGADVNKAARSYGRKPLTLAAARGHSAVVSLLIANGASINAQDNDLRTALCKAIENGHSSVAKILIEHGADVNIAYSGTQLHLAAQHGEEAVSRLLIEKGVEIDALGDAGYGLSNCTALHLAAKAGHHAIVTLLIQKGAALDIQCGDMTYQSSRSTPMQLAAEFGHADIVETLLGANANSSLHGEWDKPPLGRAVDNGHEEVVRLLVNHRGDDLNRKIYFDMRALDMAASKGYEEIARLLIEHGATIDDGVALKYAVEAGSDAVVHLLLQNGASATIQSAGSTPLHAAATNEKQSIIQQILSYSLVCDVDVRDHQARAPLHCAAAAGNEEAARLLIEYGCNIDAADKYGATALHTVIRQCDGNTYKYNRSKYDKYEKVLKLLLKHKANINATTTKGITVLHEMAKHRMNDQVELAKFLLDQGADVNARTTVGETALHIASRLNETSVVRLLLEGGADVNIADESGKRALYYAKRNASKELEQWLVDKGAKESRDADLQQAADKRFEARIREILVRSESINEVYDEKGHTLLQQAAEQGYEASTKLLLENGALVNNSTTDGNTALDTAVYWQQEAIISLLFKHGAFPMPKSLDHAVRSGDESIVQKLLQRATEVGKWGHSPYSRIYDRNDVLFTAIDRGHCGIVKILLENGFDPRSTQYGTEPIYKAADKGYEAIVRSLLEHGAYVDVQSEVSYRMAPLHIAAKNGHEGVARTLLEYNASINLTEMFRRKPLALAADEGHEALVRLLLQYDHKLADIADYLFLAAYRGDKGSVKALLECIAGKGSDASLSIHGTTALHVAAARGHHDMLPLLLEHGAKIDALTQLGDEEDRALGLLHATSWGPSDSPKVKIKTQTALQLAAKDGHETVVRTLIAYGATLNKTDHSGRTALHQASQYGYVGPVRALLNSGAEVQISDETGSTAMVLASAGQMSWGEGESNHYSVMEQLLAKGAVDTSDLEGYTGLQRAASRGDVAIVKLLLENGSNIHARNYSGKQALHHAAYTGRKDVVRLLLQYGADVHARDEFEETALHHAARGESYSRFATFDPADDGHKEVLQILLDNNDALLNERNADGKTALHLAAEAACEVTVRYLLDCGAEIEIKDYSGCTPSQCAVSGSGRFLYKQKDKIDAVLKLLVDYGAQPLGHDKKNGWD